MVWLSLFMLPCVVGCHSHDSHTVITPATQPRLVRKVTTTTTTTSVKPPIEQAPVSQRQYPKRQYPKLPSASIPSWFANGLPGRIECLDDGGSQAS